MKVLLPFVIFFLVIFLVVTITHLYLGVRLAQSFPQDSQARWIVWLLVIAMGLLILSAPFLIRMVRNSEGPDYLRTLSGLGFTLLGFVAIAVGLFLLVDFFKLTLMSAAPVDDSRRNFLLMYAPWAATALAGALSVRGFKTAMGGPEVIEVDISKPNLHPALNGLRILQLSDLHVGGLIRREYVEKVVEQSLALKPDLIVLTGDFVDGSHASLQPQVEPLKKLSAKYGVYFISGNHEYYSGWGQWREIFTQFGFKILDNAHAMLEISSSPNSVAKFMIAGLADPTAERLGDEGPNTEQALLGSSPADFALWLAHQPNLYRKIENSPCDLQLSGHTHSGQFYPAKWLIGLFHRYSHGLNLHEDKFWVYVNRGTGFWGPPNRLGLPAEITLLKLKEGKLEI